MPPQRPGRDPAEEPSHRASTRPKSWDVIAGVLECWTDEDLREVGRVLYRNGGIPVPRMRDQQEELGEESVRVVFVARRCPWQLTEMVLCTPPGQGDYTAQESVAMTVVWSSDVTTVLEGRPCSARILEPEHSWGDYSLRRLLQPSSLEQFRARPWPAGFDLPGAELANNLQVAPELISLGAETYVVRYDGSLDVITEWKTYIKGQVAQRFTLSELTAMPK